MTTTQHTAPTADGTTAGTATYVYAVCRQLAPAGLSGLPGLAEGFPVRALRCGALTAVVQHVPAADFTQEAWEQRLSDRTELERCARAHHEVVVAAAAGGPTAPLALATLYRSDERAREALGQDAARFTAVLDRIAGHAEWGVKVSLPAGSPRPPAEPPPDGARRDAPAAPGAGRAYLERKRGLHRAREHRHDQALRTAEDIDAALSRLATAARRLRTHGQELTGTAARRQILNAAYLLPHERAGDLAAEVAAWRARIGAKIELSGPWVPYSFVGEV
ncbi:gas vesicle protein [Streptomyces sp. NBRC 13847]|uniref:GvpL/GvpF family gas vesicle protein n=1 Tax=Streptomyces TaxID=1883 RepID=UPI0024A5D98D|nr:GvpL/GvpF family gas vesicle protein [Streptomyces sp. NBRC 13847]GLW14765.1 gas vesicle protein [Streptomyces sp. NBRC 13847]